MTGPTEGSPKAGLSRKSVDHARNFLSALFMSLRTAQIHDPTNKAFENAVNVLGTAARDLYSTTGAFTIQFVEDSVFLNGTRLRFADGAFASMRALRTMLESKELGGIDMQTAPTIETVRKLILLFATNARPEEVPTKDELKSLMGLLGVQKFSDGSRGMKVDRRVFAAQSYAKLILALREQRERAAQQQEVDWGVGGGAPKLRAVRVVQDLIELGSDRADFLLRLAANTKGGTPFEVYSVNTCLTTIALCHAIGLPRQDIADVAVAALFHAVGAKLDDNGNAQSLTEAELNASFARLLGEAGVSRSAYTRTMIIAEMVPGSTGKTRPHWYSRLVQVAARHQQLVTGFATGGGPRDPLEALGELAANTEGRFDPRIVDLLINVLRAFPVGTEVILDSGELAVVATQDGGSRWDRPIVRVATEPPHTLDLMVREAGRFTSRINGTRVFLGGKLQTNTLDQVGFSPLLDSRLMRSLGIEAGAKSSSIAMSAEAAGLDEVMAALDLPDDALDELDPPMLGDDAFSAVDELATGDQLVQPDERLVYTLDIPPEEPDPSNEPTGLHAPEWSLSTDESMPDAPVTPIFDLSESAPEASAELELDYGDVPVVQGVKLDALNPEPAAEELVLEPLAPDPVALDAPPAVATHVEDSGALRRENQQLKAYVATLVDTLRSAGLPVPPPPGAPERRDSGVRVTSADGEPSGARITRSRVRRPVARPTSDGNKR